MSDKVKLKEETSKLLRAVLLPSQKTGLTVLQCEQEYKGLTGSVLPYRKLGYSTADDMFSDMHNVVRISFEHGQMVVRARETEETEHLHRMVERQNMSTKDRKVLQRRKLQAHRQPSNYSSMQYSYPPRTMSAYTSAHSRSFPPQTRPSGGYHSNLRQSSHAHRVGRPAPLQTTQTAVKQSPVISEPLSHQPQQSTMQIVRGKVREVLMSYPSGLIGSSFEKAYLRRFGQSIQCRSYGFSSCLDMLRSMSDFVAIEDLSSGGYRLHCKTGSKKQERPGRMHTNVQLDRQRRRSGPSEENESCITGDTDDLVLIDSGNIGEELKSQIQHTLSKKPDGIWAARFGTEFRIATGSELPVKQLGFLSVIELISSPELSKIVTIKRPTERDWLIFDARKEDIKETVSASNTGKLEAITSPKTNTAPPIPDLFKEKLHHVLCSQQQGVLLANLPQTFLDIIGEQLNHQNLGFACLEDLVLELTDVVSLHYGGEGSAQLFLRPVEREEPSNVPIYRKLVHESDHQEIPPDAVGPGVAYIQVGLPIDQVGSYIEVYVSNVITPDNIWLQQRGVHTTEALEILMDKLEDSYYGKEGDNYKMPDSLIAIGQICVAVFPEDSNWHRVTITGIRDANFVDVFYVDYGSSCSVPRSQLRLLRNRYCKLPAQSVPATLANVKPSGKDWTRCARDALLQMCSSKPLIALVSNISQERVLSVCLCDTTGAEDVHINDVLVQQGHARFTQEVNGYDSVSPDEAPPLSPQLTPMSPASQLALKPELPMLAADLEKEMFASVCRSNESTSPVPSDPTATMLSKRRYIKFIQLTREYGYHLICVEDKGYAVSAEVSAFIWEDRNLLRTMLRLKHNLPKMVLSEEDYPDIFKEFEEMEVRGTMDGDTGKAKSCVTLYELEVVCEILDIFNHESDELKQAMKNQAEIFNHNDPYWLGEETEAQNDLTEKSEGAVDNDVGLLRQKLSNLQTRRKELLLLLVDFEKNADESQDYVDELQKVESKLVLTRNELEYVQSHQEELTALDGSGDIKTATAGKVLGSRKNMGEATKFFSTVTSHGQTKTNTVAPMPPQVPTNDPQAMLNNLMSTLGLNCSAGDASANISASHFAQQQINPQVMAHLMNMNAASSMPNVSTTTTSSSTMDSQGGYNMMAAYMAALGGGVGPAQPAGRGMGMVDPSHLMPTLRPDQQQLLNQYRCWLSLQPSTAMAANLHGTAGQLGNPLFAASPLHPTPSMNAATFAMMGGQGMDSASTSGMEANPMMGGMFGMQMSGVDPTAGLIFGQGRGRISSGTHIPEGLQAMNPPHH